MQNIHWRYLKIYNQRFTDLFFHKDSQQIESFVGALNPVSWYRRLYVDVEQVVLVADAQHIDASS